MISNLRLTSSLFLLTLLLACNTSYGQLPSPPPSHIVVIVEENLSNAEIIGPSVSVHDPYINALAANAFSAVFTNAYAITHPSQPNYLDLYSGNDQGTNGTDAIPTTTPYTTDNLGAQLLTAGKTFVTYSENMPSVGYLGANSGLYWRKHNPVAYWQASGTPGSHQYGSALNQPFTSFPTPANYSTLPTVCYVIPNSVNDMHDGSYPGCATAGDTWLSTNMNNLLTWALANNTLVILTFDEDDGSASNNITTIFYGPMVKAGTYSEHIDLYSILRTMENMYGLPYAGNAATATTITDCWRASGTGPWLSTKNVTSDNSFTVVPNPAATSLTFHSSVPVSTEAVITITDAIGREAGKYVFTGSELTVNTSTYASGVFYFRVTDIDGSTSQGKFVITQH